MNVDSEPLTAILINEIKSLKSSERKLRLESELKHMAAEDEKSSGFYHVNLCKKFFMQLQGIEIEEMDFVKAASSILPKSKAIGYLGLLGLASPSKGLLLSNCLLKDLKSKDMLPEIISFIGNFNCDNSGIEDICEKIQVVSEAHPCYTKIIVAKSKYSKHVPFSLVSGTETNLWTKIQILLNKGNYHLMSDNDLYYIESQIMATKCKFTSIKLLQLYTKLVKSGRLSVSSKLIGMLIQKLICPTTKSQRQVEIGLSIEICNLLFETNQMVEKAKVFIYRLINSENINSRYIGFKFIKTHRFITDIAIDRLITLGIGDEFSSETMDSLISKENCRDVYLRKEELFHYSMKATNNIRLSELYSLRVLSRISEVATYSFTAQMVIDNPPLYNVIRHLGIISEDRNIFNKISKSNDIDHFKLIYDTIPSTLSDVDFVGSMIYRHLNILTTGPVNQEKISTLDDLFNIMISFGDIEYNRTIVSEAFKNEEHPMVLKKLTEGFLLFNLVLDKKYIPVCDKELIFYTKNSEYLTINSPKHLRIELLDNDGTMIVMSGFEVIGRNIERKYYAKDTTIGFVLNIKNSNQELIKRVSIV